MVKEERLAWFGLLFCCHTTVRFFFCQELRVNSEYEAFKRSSSIKFIFNSLQKDSREFVFNCFLCTVLLSGLVTLVTHRLEPGDFFRFVCSNNNDNFETESTKRHDLTLSLLAFYAQRLIEWPDQMHLVSIDR